MPDTNLKVKVDADTESAVEAINDVTEAVERLNEALSELEDNPISMEINTAGDVSHTAVDILES